MIHKIRVVITEERDMFVNVNVDTVAEAISYLKSAIDNVGLSSIIPVEENILDQIITINEIDIDDID